MGEVSIATMAGRIGGFNCSVICLELHLQVKKAGAAPTVPACNCGLELSSTAM